MGKLWRFSAAIACAAAPFAPAAIVCVYVFSDRRAGAAAGGMALCFAFALGLLGNLALCRALRRSLPGRTDQERLFALSKDLLCTVGLDGYLRRVNPGFLEATGYSEAELLNTRFLYFAHPDDVNAVRQELLRVPQGKNSPVFQCRCRFKDGSYHWISWSGAFDFTEGVIYAVGRDATERKLREEQLDYMSAIVASSDDAILSTTLDGLISSWNQAAERLFGYRADEIIGRPVTVLGDSATLGEQLENIRRTSEGKQVANQETTRRRKDGRLVDVSLTISPVRAADGAMRGMSAIARDISVKKRAEAALRAANQKLQEATAAAQAANRAKSEFLANISHEIRTPMNAMMGFAECLAEGLPAHEIRNAAAVVKRNGVHLLQIINDLLDLSKIDAGRLRLDLQACSPRRIVEEAASLFKGCARGKGVELKVEIGADFPELAETDPTRLRQVLVNLLDNAVKFTERGKVCIAASVEADGGAARLRFDVSDTGIGIAAAHQQRVFEPFMQADTSVTRRYGGTGLGLAISKRLCEMLGGEIACRSAAQAGSTFTVLLPLRAPTAKPADAGKAAPQAPGRCAADKPLEGCRILVADDCPDNQRLISILLREAGAEVAAAENGLEAVQQATRRNDADGVSAPFDVIFMDMQMPVMDGYRATAELRRCGYDGSIVALTAHALMEDRQKCLQAGCDDYLAKPIGRGDLIAMAAAHRAAERAEADELAV